MTFIILIILAILAYWFLKGLFKYVIPALLLIWLAKALFGIALFSLQFIVFTIGVLIIIALLRSIFTRRN